MGTARQSATNILLIASINIAMFSDQQFWVFSWFMQIYTIHLLFTCFYYFHFKQTNFINPVWGSTREIDNKVSFKKPMCILMLSLNYLNNDIWILVKIFCHSFLLTKEEINFKQSNVTTRSIWLSRKWFKYQNLLMRNQMYFFPSIALTRMTNWWSCKKKKKKKKELAADIDWRDGLWRSHQCHTDLGHLFCITRICKLPDKMFALPRSHPVWYPYQFTAKYFLLVNVWCVLFIMSKKEKKKKSQLPRRNPKRDQ